MQRAFIVLGLAILLVAEAPAALAQAGAGGPVQTRLEARKVVRTGDGREAFAAASSAKPGDVIEYVVTYRNGGREAVTHLEATLPIPAHTQFIHGTTRPASAQASLDAAVFADMPLKRRARHSGQEPIVEPVPYSEYRYLRWHQGELRPGQSVAFSARVKVVE